MRKNERERERKRERGETAFRCQFRRELLDLCGKERYLFLRGLSGCHIYMCVSTQTDMDPPGRETEAETERERERDGKEK
jgi:hypothetical protein